MTVFAPDRMPEAAVHFNEVLIELNLVLSLLPRPFTTTMIAIEIPAAISPYSMAVAPLSSRRNFISMLMVQFLQTNVLR
jgi:hypothetical protein